jgi:hypothetical protein
MWLEVPKAFVALRRDPARERIETAGERTVGVNGAATGPEEYAAPVVGASE